MNNALNGKIALVTGGGRGIGSAIALKLASLGATTIVCGRTLARLQHTAGQIRSAGGQGEAMACDVADWSSVAALAEKIQTAFGRLDILVNNAGIESSSGPLSYHAAGEVGPDSQYQPARRLLYDPCVCTHIDCGRRR